MIQIIVGSDGAVEVTGDITAEYRCVSIATSPLMFLSNGTVLRFKWNNPIWEIVKVLKRHESKYEVITKDMVCIDEPIKWIGFGDTLHKKNRIKTDD